MHSIFYLPKYKDLKQKGLKLVFVLLPLLVGFAVVHGDEGWDKVIENRSEQVHQLLEERQNAQELVEELKRQEWGVLEVLKLLNSNIKNNQEKLNNILIEIDHLQEDIQLSLSKINGLRAQIETDKNRLHQQLIALFYLRKIKKMSLFLAVNTFEDYFRNKRLLERSSELDALTIDRLNQNLLELEQESEALKAQRAKLVTLKQSREEQKKLLDFERRQQFTYLHHIRQDRSLRVKYLRDIQVELERLNDAIHSLEIKKENEQKAKRFRGLYRYKYTLPSPVSGEVLHHFGQKNSKYYTLYKRGVLVETAEHAEVKSILQGKVVWSGPFHGYRNLIILDHGKGSFSVYGNLDEVFVIVDDVVDRSTALGTVALNKKESKYLFYFETRYNKRAVNPEQWLKKPSWN